MVGGLLSTGAFAQTTATTPVRPAAPAVVAPGAPLTAAPGVNTSTGTVPGAGIVDRNTGTTAAAGNRNQAVATTGVNAPQPASGRNSFTMSEARGRLERGGYSEVTALTKDANGIWRGSAMKDGTKTGVWLDYKGNSGRS